MTDYSWDLQDNFIKLTKQSVEMACELYICGHYNEKKLMKVLDELGYNDVRDNLRIVELMGKLSPLKDKYMKKLLKVSLRIAKKNKLI